MVFYHHAKEKWIRGHGVIAHTADTVKNIEKLEKYLKDKELIGDGFDLYSVLHAADLLANAAIWLVVHQAYAKNVYLDGRKLIKEDFKKDPQGHVGGALNMVPAYIGYLASNVVTGKTRAWMMEQGHAVAAVDSINLLVGNLSDAHKKRYALTNSGVTAFARDFYSYKINAKHEVDSPLGSHVNPYTAGGIMEGGYLGFAGLMYPHVPLAGESLVAFLSDGAFEEQRGTDWATRWWRAEDCGLIMPIMIANGRRIDQRSLMAQDGGAAWLEKHLRLNNFEPLRFDGRDPAAFVYSIIEQEIMLQEGAGAMDNVNNYRVRVPYGIAMAPKGAGFYNEGTIYAHNLPLGENPRHSQVALNRFNANAAKLYVTEAELETAIEIFQGHKKSGRVLERDHPIANRAVNLKNQPDLPYCAVNETLRQVGVEGFKLEQVSPMDAIDEGFLQMTLANPDLRPRIGNPDEMSSNRMDDTLSHHKFRVNEAERGAPESTLGNVISALNEEAVAAAAFGNKGGINIIVTYEAFGSKMFGAARQEVIFARHQREIGKPAGWLSVPIILTSNTWENSKNELSHQDPSLAEAMFLEANDVSRVIFPADYNTAMAAIEKIYNTKGQIWSVVVPKQKVGSLFTKEEAAELTEKSYLNLSFAGFNQDKAKVSIIAVGAYQLFEALKASAHLKEHKIPHMVSYVLEPARLREARDHLEQEFIVSDSLKKKLLPDHIQNVMLLTHTRPEVITGAWLDLLFGKKVSTFGFINKGGTLNVDGMLHINKCSWVHVVEKVTKVLGLEQKK